MAFTPVFANMVRAFTMSVGAGPITPGMAVEGHRSFAEALSAGDQFYYSIEGVAAPGEWEVGRGTMLADGRVARDPIASSSGGAAVDFSPGAKTIALTVASEWFEAPTVGKRGRPRPSRSRRARVGAPSEALASRSRLPARPGRRCARMSASRSAPAATERRRRC
jgi:hypothetical protein